MRAGLLRLPTLIPAAADRDLLRRFADARDEGAFAELVRRHGPLVLAVCRRVVSDTHLADDAFQATFVVLARKAATAGVGARLSTWLHSVAVKVSLRARTMAGRRAKRETLTAAVPERGLASVPPDDATAVLDEEIDRLPDHLRAAVVLCELRGVGRRDAAKELGIAEGTLSSRLAAARKKLAARLRARGVAPTVGIFSAIFVSTDLAAAAVAVSTGSVDLSSHLAQLVEGGMRMTLLTKLKLAAVAVAVAVLTVGGFGGRWGNESVAAPVPKDLADPGVIWVFRPAEGDLVGHAPDGKKLRTVKLADDLYPQLFLGVTRDGQHTLVAAEKGKVPAGNKAGYDALHAGTLTVHLWPLFTTDNPTDTGIGCQYWSRYVLGRDGKTLIVEHDRSDPMRVPGGTINYETVAYDLTTFKGTKRPALEKGFWLVEELANGDRLLGFDQHGSEKRPLQSFHLLAAGSDKPKPLTGDDETDYCSLSPDGATLLVTRPFSSKSTPTDSYHRMFLLDRATGKAAPFAHRDNTQHAHGHWSPDGKRVVYEWLEEGPQLEERILGGGLRTVPISRAQVVVSDATGKTEKVVLEYDGYAGDSHDAAQLWHEGRPKLVGWYPARRANAPVPKAATWWKEATPITFDDGGRVTSVAYSPSGKTLAVARDNGKIDFYDPATRKHVTSMDVGGEKGVEIATVTAVAFCPTLHPRNGDIFAVTHKHGVRFGTVGLGIFVDDAPKIEGIPPNLVAKDFDPHQVICLGDDRFVASSGEKIFWRHPFLDRDTRSVAGGKRGRPNVLAAIPGHSRLFLEDGHTDVGQGANDVYMAAEPPASSPQTRLAGHKSRPIAAAVSKDGKRIVSADGGGTLIVWEGEKFEFKETRRIDLGEGVVQLALAPDGRTVAAVRTVAVEGTEVEGGWRFVEPELHVFDVTNPPAKPKPLWTTKIAQDWRKIAGPVSLAFSPDGKSLLAAFGDPYNSGMDDKGIRHTGIIPGSMGVRVWTLGDQGERKPNAPVPKPAKDAGRVWFHDATANELVAYSPDLKELKRVKLPKDERFLGLTPDGASIVYANKLDGGTYHLRPLDGDGKPVDLGLDASEKDGRPYWNRDGTKFVRGRILNLPDRQSTPIRYDLFDLETKKATHLDKNFDGHWMLGWADGDHLLSRVMEGDKYGTFCRTSLDGKQETISRDDRLFVCSLAVSRTGSILVGGSPAIPPSRFVLWAMDPKTGKLDELFHEDGGGDTNPVWSPDGKRMGFAWGFKKDGANPDGWDELRLSVADSDGKNRKTVALRNKAKGEQPYGLHLLGWYPTKAERPKPKLEGKIAVWQGDSVAVLSPDGKELSRHTDEEWGGEVASPFVRLSPDGTRIAMAGTDPRNLNFGYARILSADGKKAFRSERLFGAPWAAFWLADDNQFGVNATLSNHAIPVDDGAVATVPRGGFNDILAAAPNGVQVVQHDPKKRTLRIGHPEADDKDCLFVAEKDVAGAVAGVSRDGRTLLVVAGAKVQLFDPKTGDRETVAEHAGGCRAELASDGEAVVFLTRTEPKEDGYQRATFTLSVYDRATKETAVLVRDSKTPLRAVDWWTPAPPANPLKKNAPVPKEKDAGLLWVKDEKANQLTAYTPALNVARRVKLPAFGKFLGLTPDGANIVYAARAGARAGTWYFLRPLDEDAAATFLELDHVIWDFPPIWSPDGKKFLRVRKDVDRKIPEWNSTVFRYDVFDLDTKKATHLADVPYDHWILDWAADGKKFLTQSLRKGEENSLHEMTADGTSKPLPAEEKVIRPYKLARSPDGRTFLFSSYDSLWAIDAATGKRKELLDKTHGFPKPAWSPDGKRMAVAYCQTPTGDRVKPWEVQRLAVADADGKNRKEIVLRDKAKGEDAYDAEFLGWFPATADRLPVPKKNAPVPKVKEETMGLTASVAFDKKEIMLGEPVYFTFAVKNPTDTAWQFEQGGDYRNRLGRPNSFAVTVTGPDGKAVPQPDSGMDMGGMSHLVKLPADGTASFWPLFLPHWATFDKPGEYTVTVKRKVGLVPADAEDGFRAKATPVNLSATAKITVVPVDKKKMGELIESLGKTMLDRKAVGQGVALEKMQTIRDSRVIPHFIELGKRPSHHERTAACRKLGQFKTDEAFAALKKLYATTGIDLRESTTKQELADSSANGVRHSAIGAILDCGHPDALAFGWKMALADSYDGVRLTALHKAYEVKSPEARKVIAALLTDADERIRGEAKRYTELLAKEKK